LNSFEGAIRRSSIPAAGNATDAVGAATLGYDAVASVPAAITQLTKCMLTC